jgi:hypothetical protein
MWSTIYKSISRHKRCQVLVISGLSPMTTHPKSYYYWRRADASQAKPAHLGRPPLSLNAVPVLPPSTPTAPNWSIDFPQIYSSHVSGETLGELSNTLDYYLPLLGSPSYRDRETASTAISNLISSHSNDLGALNYIYNRLYSEWANNPNTEIRDRVETLLFLTLNNAQRFGPEF